MLQEIKNVKQERGPGRRRWFESDGLEVVVWLNRDGKVTGFQLCYDLGQGEHALTWRSAGGFVHSRIDMGDDNPLVNRSPVLQPDGKVPWPELAHLFDRRSSTLDASLRRLIRAKLVERTRSNAN